MRPTPSTSPWSPWVLGRRAPRRCGHGSGPTSSAAPGRPAWSRRSAHPAGSRRPQRRAREAGVVAEVYGILLDEPGAIWHSPLEDRVIGVRPDQLRRARVIAAAPDVGEPEAVIAAARSGLVDDIVLAPELAAQVSALLD